MSSAKSVNKISKTIVGDFQNGRPVPKLRTFLARIETMCNRVKCTASAIRLAAAMPRTQLPTDVRAVTVAGRQWPGKPRAGAPDPSVDRLRGPQVYWNCCCSPVAAALYGEFPSFSIARPFVLFKWFFF